MEGFAKRFTGASEEPHAPRGPLAGMFMGLAVPSSLEASLDTFETTDKNDDDMDDTDPDKHKINVYELAHNVEMANEFAKSKVAGGDTSMPPHYMASILLYTCEFFNGASVYSYVNQLLRDADRKKVKVVKKYIWLLMKALERCPAYEGTLVFRGIKGLPHSAFVAGMILTWLQFSSTAARVEVQNEFLGQEGERTLLSIELTTGQGRVIDQYSFYPNEREVLLPANTRIEVVAIFNAGGGLTQVQLKEVKPLDSILVFEAKGTTPALLPPTPSSPTTPSKPPVSAVFPPSPPQAPSGDTFYLALVVLSLTVRVWVGRVEWRGRGRSEHRAGGHITSSPHPSYHSLTHHHSHSHCSLPLLVRYAGAGGAAAGRAGPGRPRRGLRRRALEWAEAAALPDT